MTRLIQIKFAVKRCSYDEDLAVGNGNAKANIPHFFTDNLSKYSQ